MELRLASLTTAEIAHVLGVTTQNVRTAQARAVSKLRQSMAAAGVPKLETPDA